MDLGFHRMVLLGGLPDHLQLKHIRKHGQVLHLPLLIFFVIILRIRQGDQMAQSPCDDIAVPLNSSVLVLTAFQYPGNIPGNGWFFRDYK